MTFYLQNNKKKCHFWPSISKFRFIRCVSGVPLLLWRHGLDYFRYGRVSARLTSRRSEEPRSLRSSSRAPHSLGGVSLAGTAAPACQIPPPPSPGTSAGFQGFHRLVYGLAPQMQACVYAGAFECVPPGQYHVCQSDMKRWQENYSHLFIFLPLMNGQIAHCDKYFHPYYIFKRFIGLSFFIRQTES